MRLVTFVLSLPLSVVPAANRSKSARVRDPSNTEPIRSLNLLEVTEYISLPFDKETL